ncbi:hypothetical protein C791_0294 [Amycolatopsis azurea DSM 43854]|uniref:Uncharacterized protein n=1 Tax=Amycolatopsis azurea DSM 43854 TaxID=1238180 RepID=M2PRT0_9PSEU|nr:hypothetical protein C791_0294 [Amycolatopsis azurea DSM 43854]
MAAGHGFPGDHEVRRQPRQAPNVQQDRMRDQEQPARVVEPDGLEQVVRQSARRVPVFVLKGPGRVTQQVDGLDYPLWTDFERPQHRSDPRQLEPQAVVVVEYELQGCGEGLDVGPGRHGQQHGLRPHRVAQFSEPEHFGQERERADAVVDHRLGRRDGGGERGRGTEFEDVLGAQFEPGPPGAARHCDRRDAVAAQQEEVAVGAHRVQSEDVRENPREGAFPVVLGRGGGLLDRRRGQCPDVELSAGRQRELVEHHERGRDHRSGQGLAHPGPQPLGIRSTGHIADERAVLRHDRGGRDLRLCGEDRFDLAEFDPVAADLHLTVGAAEVVDLAVGATPDEVPGAVQPLSGFAERVGDEAFGGQTGPPVVAAGQLDTGEIQLARHAVGHRAEAAVEDVRPRVPHRTSDGDSRALGAVGVEVGHVHGGLGGTVEVVQRDAGERTPARGGLAGQRLAAGEDPAQGAEITGGRLAAEERGEHGRDEVQGGDPPLPDQPREIRGIAVAVRFGQHHRRAFAQRPEELPHGHVEARRRLLEHAVRGREPVLVLHPREPVDDRAMRDGHTLRPSGRSRRVDHVRGVIRPGGDALDVFDGGLAGHGDLRQPGDGRNPRRRPGFGKHEPGTGVGEHEVEPVRRIVEVDRQVGGPGLVDGQQRDHQLDRPRHGDGHDLVGTGAEETQPAGQPLRPGVEVRIGQLGVLEHHRGRGRRLGDLLGEGLGQRPLGHRMRGRVELRQAAAFGGREQVDGGDRQAGIRRQRLQQPREAFREVSGRDRVDPGGVEFEAERQVLARGRDHRDREVHRVGDLDSGEPHGSGRIRALVVTREVLDDHEGVERFFLAEAGDTLDFAEAEVLVVQQGRLLVLRSPQHGGDGFGRGPAQPHRHRVDVQADSRFEAVGTGVATGDRAAEQHVVPAGEPAEEQPPSAVQDGAEGEAVRSRHGGQLRRGSRTKVQVNSRRPPFGREPSLDQPGGFVHFGQCVAPGFPGDLVIARREPPQVVRTGARFRERRVRSGVSRQQFAQQHHDRPAVGDDVVERQRQLGAVFAHPGEGRPQQGRAREVEPAHTIGLEGFRGIFGGHLPPGQFGVPGHRLDDLAAVELPETGPQRRVPVQQRLRRPAQRVGVDVAFEVQHLLDRVDVSGRAAFELRVEEEPFLQRRHGQDVGVLGERRAFGAGQLQQRSLVHSGHGGLADDRLRARGERLGSPVLEHLTWRDGQALLRRAEHQPDGQDAVAAEGEEVVVGAGRAQPEDGRDDVTQDPFPLGARRAAGGGGTEVGQGQ